MKKELLQMLAGNWAIDPKKFENFCSSDYPGDKMFKDSNEPNHRNNVDMKGDVAVMHIDGALTYRSNMWKMFFGDDTYNSISDAFDELLANDDVKGIVLSIHSPGGQISGVSDLAEKIYAARGQKEYGIVAHTSGDMCSAAYWIGSACERVTAAPAAIIGSIGVMSYIPGTSEAGPAFIRSNLSRNKNLDPNTPAGRDALEKTLDSSAKVFMESVAKYRGTTYEDVLDNYGQGALFVGQEAVENGMIDEIISLDALVESMSNKQGGYMPNSQTQSQTPAVSAESQQEMIQAAVAAERTRIAGVTAAFEGLGLESDLKAFVAEGKTVAEAESFCLSACKKQMADLKAAATAKPAEPAPAAAEPGANASAAAGELTAEQKALIAAGLAAQSGAANGVQSGANDPSAATAEADKVAFDAFAAGANGKIF